MENFLRKASIVTFILGVVIIIFFLNFYAELTGDNFGSGYGIFLIGAPVVSLGIILFGFSLKGLIKIVFFTIAIFLALMSFWSLFGFGLGVV